MNVYLNVDVDVDDDDDDDGAVGARGGKAKTNNASWGGVRIEAPPVPVVLPLLPVVDVPTPIPPIPPPTEVVE